MDSGLQLRAMKLPISMTALLAKLIVHAGSREDAIQRMKNALNDFIVHGVVTNIDYMRAVLEADDFKQGKVSTNWVETNFSRMECPTSRSFTCAP
ncbi:MAG: hypothetical protein IPG44_12985 [Anaerolineales bacterium]|nr:hypothetical protein [Anaerolineales bacterium]